MEQVIMRTLHELGHGPRLSAPEYQQQIAELYLAMLRIADQRHEAELFRRELDLTIDHRLGRGFPQPRREALWRIQQRVEAIRAQLIGDWLPQVAAAHNLQQQADQVAQLVVDAYAEELGPQELAAYFGNTPVQRILQTQGRAPDSAAAHPTQGGALNEAS